MKCPSCGSTLNIGKTLIVFEGDNSPDTPTIAYTIMPMVCSNPECSIYGGHDLNNPTRVVQTLRQKMN